MPFTFDLLEEQEQKKQQAPGEEGAAPAMTGGGQTFGGSAPGGAPSGPAAPKAPAAPKQGSGFVNLDRYMEANQGSGFGKQLTGKVEGDLQKGRQGLEQNQQAFADASNQGSQKWSDIESGVKDAVERAGTPLARPEVSIPTPVGQSQQPKGMSADQVKKAQSAQYQGPESFTGSNFGAQAEGGIRKATQAAKALQSEGGRFALLDQYFGRPQYSTGQKALDNLLVQNQPGVQARAQNLGTQAQKLASDSGLAARDMDNLAAANKQATGDSAAKARETVQKGLSDFRTDLEGRYADYRQGAEDYNQARLQDLGDDTVDSQTAELLKSAGLGHGSQLYDLDLKNYLNQGTPANLSSFASPEDYARYLALEELAGGDPSLLLEADRSAAGTGGTGRSSLDVDRLKADLQQRSLGAAQIPGLQEQLRTVELNPFGSDPAKVQALQQQIASLQSQYRPDRKLYEAERPRDELPDGPRPIRDAPLPLPVERPVQEPGSAAPGSSPDGRNPEKELGFGLVPATRPGGVDPALIRKRAIWDFDW